jgi:hypothetical protein|tara:strand:+ start:67 stop:546 length:480 start_codon:yes stop_codon:yes gene_type:complete
MIDPKQIYTAHFTDNEQTTIEVLLGTEQPGVFESMIIPYNPTEDNCKSVLGIIDMDKLQENTYQRKKSESEALMDLAVNAAKAEGRLNVDPKYYTDLDKKEYYQKLIDFLLEENEESIEDLFAFKIALFDTEKVKNATKATKSKIRKAKTALEALKVIT